LIDWLDYNGYTVVTKATKEFIDASGRRKVKGNMDIELAVDAMELAEHVDQIVLFSGDGDFRSLVEAVQRRGVRVTVVSTISSQPPMIADELRRQADVFTDLVELQSKLGRDPSERPPPREQRASTCAGVRGLQRAVHCVPPQNKPLPAEINTCRPFLIGKLETMPNLRAIVALGRIAHDTTLKALGLRAAAAPFSHGAVHQAGAFKLYDSYHCSRYNTNTRVLTPDMFRSVFAKVRADLG
jgi:uracil-DNA glycosylase